MLLNSRLLPGFCNKQNVASSSDRSACFLYCQLLRQQCVSIDYNVATHCARLAAVFAALPDCDVILPALTY